MIRGAIFDADGTLLDSMGIWNNVGTRYLNSLQIPAEENLDKILFSMSMEQGAEYLKEHYRLSQDPGAIIGEILDMIESYYKKEAPLKEGVASFLEKLQQKGIPAVIATSSSHSHIEAACRRLGIRQYFRQILTCTQVGEGKDSPLVYQAAAEVLGTAPRQTWIFEDVLHAIVTAKKAGFQTVGVYDRFSDGDTEKMIRQADLYLPDLTDFERFWSIAAR